MLCLFQQTIRRAVEKHNAELAKVLNGRELRFIVQTEDFPIIRKCVVRCCHHA